jgi:hypothetical protein
MFPPPLLAALLLAASPPPAHTAPASTPPGAAVATVSEAAKAQRPVILFLIDNSASLPPLDPDEKRVQALEKMFGFLEGQPYRLILFGGRREIYVDDVSRYRNNGQWTDFYFAFAKAKELMDSYPKGTEFRSVLLTDALPDPDPADWADMSVPEGEDVKTFSIRKALELLSGMKIPLYVVLVGDVPKEGVVAGDREQSPALILDMVRAANGREASPLAQTLSSFFKDDGLLVKKFVYRVQPNEGLKRVEPILRRIVAPARAGVELQFLSLLVLPLTLFVLLLVGILVRSFPGPGDVEIVELHSGLPVHLAADKLHRLEDGGWGTSGLSLLPDAKGAVATLAYQAPPLELTGIGLETEGLDELSRKLLPLGVDELRRALEQMSDSGSKEEKIYALNLDYVAKNFEPAQAEGILQTAAADRRKLAALDFLRAKAHLISNAELRRKLTDARVQMVGYGKDAERKDLTPGTLARVGPYGFVVKEVVKGGRKELKLVLYYERIPSLLGLKNWVPDGLQRLVRFRRSSTRVVS